MRHQIYFCTPAFTILYFALTQSTPNIFAATAHSTNMCNSLEKIRSELLGAWEMVEHYAYLPSDETNKTTPMGRGAQAIIVYTPDGYMSAQFHTFQKVDLGLQSQHDTGSTASTPPGPDFMAYSGEFYLEEAENQAGLILKHHARITNLPHLSGVVQSRTVEISDEYDAKYLQLGSIDPINFSGEERFIKVRWRRLPYNAPGRI